MQPRRILSELHEYIPGKSIEGAIKLASNENPLGYSPKLKKALLIHLDHLSRYPESTSLELREKLAEHWELKKENFVVAAGSDQVLTLIADAFIESGDEVLISENTFSQYEYSARLAEAQIKRIPSTSYDEYDLDGFEKAVSKKTKIIYLCSPNNPTGLIIPKDKLRKFIKKLPEHVLVVLDEAYAEYVESKLYHDSYELVKEFPQLILLRTFSKIYGLANLRIGYGISHESNIKVLNKVKGPFNVSGLAQKAAVLALQDKAFVLKSFKNNKIQKKVLYSEFEKKGFLFYPTEANFIYLKLNQEATVLTSFLEKKGITIRGLASFGKSQAVRISIGSPEQNQKLIEALKKINKL